MSLTYPIITVHPCDVERAVRVSRVMGHRSLIATDDDWNPQTIGVQLPWDWPAGLVEQDVRRACPGWTPIVTVEPSPVMTAMFLRSGGPEGTRSLIGDKESGPTRPPAS